MTQTTVLISWIQTGSRSRFCCLR